MRLARTIGEAHEQWAAQHAMTPDQWRLAHQIERATRITVHTRPPGRLAEIGEPWTWPQAYGCPAHVRRSLMVDNEWTATAVDPFTYDGPDLEPGSLWLVLWARTGFDEHPATVVPIPEPTSTGDQLTPTVHVRIT